MDDVLGSIVSRIGVDLTFEDDFKVGEINRKLREVNKEWLGQLVAGNKKGLTKNTLKQLRKHHEGKFQELVEQRDKILRDPEAKQQALELHSEIKTDRELNSFFYEQIATNKEQTIKQFQQEYRNLNVADKDSWFKKAKLAFKKEGIKNQSNNSIKERAEKIYIDSRYSKRIEEGFKAGEQYIRSNKDLNGIDIDSF